MSTRDSAVALEEEAELRELRDRADRTTAEAARTLAELTARLACARLAAAIPVLAVTGAMIVAYRRGYLPPRA